MSDRTTLQQKFRIIETLRPDQVIDPSLLADIQSFISDALVIGEKRNRYIHDLWVFDAENVKKGKLTRHRIKDLDNWKFSTAVEEEPLITDLENFLIKRRELLNRY